MHQMEGSGTSATAVIIGCTVAGLIVGGAVAGVIGRHLLNKNVHKLNSNIENHEPEEEIFPLPDHIW